MSEMKKCTYCKNEKEIKEFMSEAGRELKMCQRCRSIKAKSNYKPKKCPHNRRKSQCKQCGGSQICEHNRHKSSCKECGGSQICEHHRLKSGCKECGGVSICEHNRIKSRCKECGGGSICEHNRLKSQCKECGGSQRCEHNRMKSGCKECGGSQICEHNRIKSRCKECGGGSICEHNRMKSQCKDCSDAKKITIQSMIKHSKEKDLKINKYDANNFIDKCFIEMLMDESMKCYYCKIEMQLKEYNSTLCTIERLDNGIGHIKSNCVLACKKCNVSKFGQRNNLNINVLDE
jgi:hypothetical protein